MKVGTMKPGEIRQDPKPQVIQPAHAEAVLKILTAQLEVLKALTMPPLYIPSSVNLDLE